MNNQRYQNDRHFIWFFYLKDGKKTPFLLEGKDLELEVNVGLSRFQVENFTVSGNAVDFIFRGRTQNRPGPIVLTLYVNRDKDGMMTFDALAGGMVPHSDMGGSFGPSGTRSDNEAVTSFVGEWIDERLIPASIARLSDVERDNASLRETISHLETNVLESLKLLQEAGPWSDGLVWDDSLIWRE